MKVFISWSGERSRRVADALRNWLPKVIQAIDPWISSADVEKGSRWSPDVARHPEAVKVGIICLTPENLDSSWVLFEAGALSRTLDITYICPYLFDLEPAQVGQPLGQFQATKAERSDTKRLICTLNQSLGDQALARDRLDEAFDQWWPDLERELAEIPPSAQAAAKEIDDRRSDRDLLEELLALVRSHESGLKQLSTQLQVLRLQLEHTGTYALSESLQQLAVEQTEAHRRDRMKRQLALAEEQERTKKPFPPVRLVSDEEPQED